MAQTRSGKRLVLVVDDEFLIRMFAVDILHDLGFTTVEACCCDEALEVIATHPGIDVMLTDINMPGEFDGLALAHKVRASHPEMHVVVTSGRMRPIDDELPIRSVFVGKPYSLAEMDVAMSAG